MNSEDKKYKNLMKKVTSAFYAGVTFIRGFMRADKKNGKKDGAANDALEKSV